MQCLPQSCCHVGIYKGDLRSLWLGECRGDDGWIADGGTWGKWWVGNGMVSLGGLGCFDRPGKGVQEEGDRAGETEGSMEKHSGRGEGWEGGWG